MSSFAPHPCQQYFSGVWILIASSNRELGRRLLVGVTWMRWITNTQLAIRLCSVTYSDVVVVSLTTQNNWLDPAHALLLPANCVKVLFQLYLYFSRIRNSSFSCWNIFFFKITSNSYRKPHTAEEISVWVLLSSFLFVLNWSERSRKKCLWFSNNLTIQ